MLFAAREISNTFNLCFMIFTVDKVALEEVILPVSSVFLLTTFSLLLLTGLSPYCSPDDERPYRIRGLSVSLTLLLVGHRAAVNFMIVI
jgi:hypothetical protein